MPEVFRYLWKPAPVLSQSIKLTECHRTAFNLARQFQGILILNRISTKPLECIAKICMINLRGASCLVEARYMYLKRGNRTNGTSAQHIRLSLASSNQNDTNFHVPVYPWSTFDAPESLSSR